MQYTNAAPARTDDAVTGPEYQQRCIEAGKRYLADVARILDEIKSLRKESDRLGMVPQRSVDLMEQAGVFRAMTPRRFGGREIDPA